MWKPQKTFLAIFVLRTLITGRNINKGRRKPVDTLKKVIIEYISTVNTNFISAEHAFSTQES